MSQVYEKHEKMSVGWTGGALLKLPVDESRRWAVGLWLVGLLRLLEFALILGAVAMKQQLFVVDWVPCSPL